MPAAPTRYQPVGPVLMRASTAPDMDGAVLPDLTGPAATQHQRAWLAGQWACPELREAVTMASRDLASRVDQLLNADADPPAKVVRRAVLSIASYLVRWQRRTTPFGLFAGVTTTAIGPAATRIGEKHRAVARADADWLAAVIDRLERQHGLRRRLTVVADSGGFVRDGRVITAGRPEVGARTPGPARETSTRYTLAVQAALTYAAVPVRFDRLADQLAVSFPQVAPCSIEAMLHGLIDGHVLITGLRPPMTVVDALAYLLDALTRAGGDHPPEVMALVHQLGEIHAQLSRHNAEADPDEQAAIRSSVTAAMDRVVAGAAHPIVVDVCLDAEISIPARVLDETAVAAGVLLRLTTQPFGSAAWLDYHTRFRGRYGVGALVPVRDLVADSGLGYPTGYLGAPRARPAWRVLTERDARLLALIQRANLDRAEEIALTDADIKALTIGDHTAVVAPARVELTVSVDAPSTIAVNDGHFSLRVIGAPRAYTSMAGRFAYLFDATARQQVTHTVAAPGDEGDVVAVHLSFPPRRVHNDNVTRVGRLTAEVVSVSEHPDGDVISIDDLAVTCDADQLYLVRGSTGQRVIAHIPHALDTTVQTPVLARFIAEVGHARTAVFGPFDFAAARTLPHTPRIRYRRTVLAPARWLLTTDDLAPAAGAAKHSDEQWDKALDGWRQRWRVPARVIVCHGELRLPLDLDQPVERVLLRTRLARAERLELREDGPADGHGWLGRPAELLIPLTLTPPATRPLPVTSTPGRTHHPGGSTVLHAQLVGNPACFDELLTGHLAPLADALTDCGVRHWWVKRHRDMIRLDADQHLSVVLRLHDPDAYGAVAARLAELTDRLHAAGMPAQLTIASYHEHPGRYGHGQALQAAERVFAADTTAAIAQLRTATHADIPGQVLAAASMTQLAAALAADRMSGYRALLDCLQQHTEPADRALTHLACTFADHTDSFARLRALPGGDVVAAAWQARDTALRSYHASLRAQRDPAGVLRTLLHEHHVRAVGVDPEFERKTCHLARAAAMRRLATTTAP